MPHEEPSHWEEHLNVEVQSISSGWTQFLTNACRRPWKSFNEGNIWMWKYSPSVLAEHCSWPVLPGDHQNFWLNSVPSPQHRHWWQVFPEVHQILTSKYGSMKRPSSICHQTWKLIISCWSGIHTSGGQLVGEAYFSGWCLILCLTLALWTFQLDSYPYH